MKKNKDKPFMKTTMKEFAENSFPDGKRKTIIQMPGKSNVEKKIDANIAAKQHNWDEMEKDIDDYNSRVTDLDPDYESFTPFREVIVRCFHLEMQKNSSGLVSSPPIVYVPEMTQNGLGIRQTVESPWAFSRKAVVVSVPEGFIAYKPGDIVQLDRRCVVPEKPSRDTDYLLPFSFTLWEHQDFSPPRSKKDKHYGYLIIDPYKFIQGKIKGSENTVGERSENKTE